MEDSSPNGAPRRGGESTYSCPICAAAPMARAELLAHAESAHRVAEERNTVVCPICAAAPSGDPNRRLARGFLEHMRRFHSFNVGDYLLAEDGEAAALAADGDAGFQRAIAESLAEAHGKPGAAAAATGGGGDDQVSDPPPVQAETQQQVAQQQAQETQQAEVETAQQAQQQLLDEEYRVLVARAKKASAQSAIIFCPPLPAGAANATAGLIDIAVRHRDFNNLPITLHIRRQGSPPDGAQSDATGQLEVRLMQKDIMEMKMAELKDELRRRNCAGSGSKQALRLRLIDRIEREGLVLDAVRLVPIPRRSATDRADSVPDLHFLGFHWKRKAIITYYYLQNGWWEHLGVRLGQCPQLSIDSLPWAEMRESTGAGSAPSAPENGTGAASAGALERGAQLSPRTRSAIDLTPNGKWWKEMRDEEHAAAALMGWTADSWDAGDQAPFKAVWSELGELKQRAATVFKFGPEHFAKPAGEHTWAAGAISAPHRTPTPPSADETGEHSAQVGAGARARARAAAAVAAFTQKWGDPADWQVCACTKVSCTGWDCEQNKVRNAEWAANEWAFVVGRDVAADDEATPDSSSSSAISFIDDSPAVMAALQKASDRGRADEEAKLRQALLESKVQASSGAAVTNSESSARKRSFLQSSDEDSEEESLLRDYRAPKTRQRLDEKVANIPQDVPVATSAQADIVRVAAVTSQQLESPEVRALSVASSEQRPSTATPPAASPTTTTVQQQQSQPTGLHYRHDAAAQFRLVSWEMVHTVFHVLLGEVQRRLLEGKPLQKPNGAPAVSWKLKKLSRLTIVGSFLEACGRASKKELVPPPFNGSETRYHISVD